MKSSGWNPFDLEDLVSSNKGDLTRKNSFCGYFKLFKNYFNYLNLINNKGVILKDSSSDRIWFVFIVTQRHCEIK